MQFDNVKTTKAEAQRIELPLGDKVVGFMVTFCDPRSTSYIRTRDEISRPVRKLIEVKKLPPEKDRAIAVRTFVRECVKGWDGVTSGGETVPFTEDNCVDLLVQSPKLFYDLVDEAGERENFMPGEGDAGN